MRNLKRFLAMTLTMLMVVGCFVMTSSAKFDDVTDFQNEITILSNLGVIKGNADGTFGFDQAVTRRQEALFIARAATGKVNDTVWTSTVNNSKFTDLDATGDYYGAISYCANLGIIKGRTSTEFYPNDNIIFQEAVAMVVRALGYGSDTMNAGYPYSFYDKAVSLGLDNGLEDVALTDVVSRGVAAKLLYNTLFAINSNGVTMASSAFGAVVKSTNIVLISTDSKKLVTNYSLPTAAGTVAFCEFNSDGTLNLDKVYNLNWNEFAKLAFGADTTKKAADYVGASFAITTTDGFKTLSSVTENASKTFTQADANGSGKIAGTEYALVDKWSSVFTTGTTWNGKNEILQFNTAFTKGNLTGNTAFYGNHWYVVNANNDILDTNGNILLYYKPLTVGSVFPFCYKIGADFYPAYLPVDGSAYAGAATVDQLGAKATYATNMNAAKYTSNVSAYADTVAYDDNNDGSYDRAYFTNYTFGQFFTFTKDGHTYYNVTLGAKGNRISADNNIDGANRGFKDITLVNISGKDVKDGNYVLWARDAVNNTLIIKKVYGDAKVGFVTSVNPFDKSITIMNTTTNIWPGVGTSTKLYYGVAKLPGATATNADGTINDDGTGAISAEALIGVTYTIQNTTISYVVDEDRDNKIVAITNEAAASEPMVVDAVLTNNTTYATPYLTLRVIMNDGTMKNIYVSKVGNQQIFGYANSTYGITKGTLLLGAKLGQLEGIANVDNWKVDIVTLPYTASADTKLNFYNGIAYENQPNGAATIGTKLLVNNTTGLYNFAFQQKDGNLVIITRNPSGSFSVAKGIPAQGSELSIPMGSTVYADSSKGYMYIVTTGNNYATFGTGFTVFDGSWQTSTAGSDIIYFVGGNPVGSVYENDYFYPTSYWVYQSGNSTSSFWSMMTGKADKDVSEFIYSKDQLVSGTFYYIKNMTLNGATVKVIAGAVSTSTLLADKDNTTYAIRPVILKTFVKGSYVTTCDNTGANTVVVPGNVAVYNWTAGNKGTEIAASALAADQAYVAFQYAGDTTNYMVPSVKYYFVTNIALTSYAGLTASVTKAGAVVTAAAVGDTLNAALLDNGTALTTTGSTVTYQWSVGGTAIPGATAATYTATVAGNLTVTITYTDALGTANVTSGVIAVA